MKSKYTHDQKLEAIALARVGNKSAVAKQYGITRATLYKWIEQEEFLHSSSEEAAVTVAIDLNNAMTKIAEDKVDLDRHGEYDARKKLMASALEAELIRKVSIMTQQTDEKFIMMSPKDQITFLEKANAIKKDLYDEPTMIIEYRNNWMEQVIKVLSKMMDRNQLTTFVEKMHDIEEANEINMG